MDKLSAAIAKKSFSMFFGGGEIWFEHIDGLGKCTDIAAEKLVNDSKQFCRPSLPSLIAINVDETFVTDELVYLISDKLLRSGKQFTRTAVVGADKYTRRRLEEALRGAPFALKFFGDFEKAKQWLISEELT